MTPESVEAELARKFIAKWSLNVQERKSLPTGALPGSLLVAEICALVEDKGWYPIDWRPNDDFDGGLIERLDLGGYKVHWKVECGVSRFALQEVNEFASPSEAARKYAVKFFGGNFDGIEIDWER
jgi:hypothetical protein